MKLHKVLTINGQVYQLANDDTRLDLHNPGRASYQLVSDKQVSGLVTLDIGWNTNPLQRLFYGYVESCNQTNDNLFIIFCREAAYCLEDDLPINLRHCTLTQVIQEIARVTGLTFRLPDKAYTRSQAPFFYNLANGFYALDTIGDVFNIPRYFWQQQGNGEIFVGSYNDSFFATKTPFQIEPKFFKDYQGNNMGTLTPLPGLRPGALINNNQIITSLMLTNEEMTIKWNKLSNVF